MKIRINMIALIGFILTAMPSYSSPIYEGVWQLSNRGNGGSLGSNYGFGRRIDGGWELFDFEHGDADVKLTYDSPSGTVVIRGQAYSNYTNKLVDIDLIYSGIESNEDSIGTSIQESVGYIDGVEVISLSSRSLNESLFLNSLTNEGALKGTGWVGTDQGHYGDFHFAGTQINGSSAQSGIGSIPAPSGIMFILLAGATFLIKRKRFATL